MKRQMRNKLTDPGRKENLVDKRFSNMYDEEIIIIDEEQIEVD